MEGRNGWSALLGVIPLLLVPLLMFACQAPQPGGSVWSNYLSSFAEPVLDAEIRTDGTAALRKYAPEAIPLIDQPTRDASGAVVGPPDGVITLAEVKAVVASAADPAQLTWLALMVREIIEARRHHATPQPPPPK